jgi:hypothetical protein
MKLINRGSFAALLIVALAAMSGCVGIAPDGTPMALGSDELVAEVAGLDIRYRELTLRPSSGPARLVGYHDDTRMIYRGREYPVTQLDVGDIVALKVKQDSRGRFYADLIRVEESIRDRRAARPERRLERLEGTVEVLDRPRGTFEIREPSGSRVVVSLPHNARRPDIDKVQRLRTGDYVRLEGRFIHPDRFELDAFV